MDAPGAMEIAERLRKSPDIAALLEEGGVLGRKLDFLVQEMNREINTVGSKSNDSEISLSVVAVKAEIEKIKEQVQNIE